MPILGAPRTFQDKFKFLVEIAGFSSAGFQKFGELSVEAAKIEYSEGGSLIPNKSPGRLTYSDVTLERGAAFDDDMYDWMSEVAQASIQATLVPGAGLGFGLVDPLFKRDLDVVQQDRNGATLKRWRLFQAWPTKFVAGEWDNEADEKVIEMITLTYDFFILV
jgi:phage tail-like protein